MNRPGDFLRAESVCRYYRRKTSEVRAVDRVSLSISRGEFVSIVGSSGSGKSTLLNLLAGLDRPTGGKITFNDRHLDAMTRRELAEYRANRVGMVFQAFNLVSHLTAQGNVELAMFFNKTAPKQRRLLASEALERLGLADRADHRPADLSGGEQQRVAIARAVVKRPEILLADEPTGNLDEANSSEIASLLGQLNAEGLTVIMVTHNTSLADQTSQRTVRMHYGRIVDETGKAL